MLLTKWAPPRVRALCRINSCDPCLSLVPADGLTWTWGAPSQCLACVPEAAAVPKACLLLGRPGPIALCVTLSRTLECLSVLPVARWAIVGPRPVCSARRVWRRMRQMFPAQLVWALPLYLRLLGRCGLRALGGEDLAYVESLTQVGVVRKWSLQKHCLASSSDNAPAEISGSLFSVFVVAANTDLLLPPVKILVFDWLLWQYFLPANQRVTAIPSPSNFSQWWSVWALLKKGSWLLSIFLHVSCPGDIVHHRSV